MSMNKWLIIVLLSCMGSVHAAWWTKEKPAKAVTVSVATDLSVLAKQAKDRKLPILLMVSQDHCPFCSLLKSDVLNPMLLSGDYDDRVIIKTKTSTNIKYKKS